jgi:hypothetical protein
MRLLGFLVRTPSDLRPTLQSQQFAHSILAQLDPEFEPSVRRAIDAIFVDLQNLDTDDASMVAVYLDSVEEPLAFLRSLGIDHFALMASGALELPDGRQVPQWGSTHYMLIPRGAFFRPNLEHRSTLVHSFDPMCKDALDDLYVLSRGASGATIYRNRPAIEQDFEGSVPWCHNCALHGLE